MKDKHSQANLVAHGATQRLITPPARSLSRANSPFGEVGSRSLQRLLITQISVESINNDESRTFNLLINDWVEVQEDRYRYLAIDDAGDIRIKIVIAEYLACEVTWTM